MSRRGPPPRQLAKLFRLKYLRGIERREELASLLGISEESVRIYENRLRKKLVTQLKQVSPERLLFVCPECLAAKVYEDPETGERVCMNCGYVLDESKMSETIPFGTEEAPNTYALTSHIAYGKSLGFTMPKSHLFRVLAKVSMENGASVSEGENGKIPIPIRQIQTITETVDPPIVKSILNYGSRLLKELGLDRDTDSNHTLADQYGRLLRKIGAYIMVSKSNLQPYQAARAALAYILSKVDPEKAKEVTEKYPFNSKYMDLVTMLMAT